MEGISAYEALEGAGLTNIESKVYLELLELGSSTAGPIIKSLGLHRATVYTVLQRLIEKGLVSYIMRGGKRHFSATDPENILDDVKEREERLKDILPQLKVRQKRAKEKQLATLYEGNRAIRTMFEEALKRHKPGDEQLVFGTQDLNDFFIKFFRSYERRRAMKGVKLKIAINEADTEWISSSKSLPRTEIKTIPKEFSSPAEFNILGDRTAIVLWGKNPVAFAIDSKEVSDSFRSYFNLMWNQDVTVARGVEGVQGAWNRMLDELKRGEEYYVLGASWRGQKEKVYEWFVDFHNRRRKKGVKAKLLFVSGTEKLVEKYRKNYRGKAETKFLPSGIYEGIQVNLYKNKTLIFVWREKEPVVFTIDDKRIYQTFKTYFDALWSEEINTYKGSEGIKTAFRNLVDELNPGEEVHIMGVHDFGKEFMPLALFFQQIRSKKGIKAKFLMNNNAKNIAKQFNNYPPVEIQFMPEDVLTPAIFIIYKDKVIINVAKEQTFFLIKNKRTAQSFDSFFNMLWTQKTITYKGGEGVKSFFNQLLDEKDVWFIGGNFGIKKYFPDYWKWYKKERIRRKQAWHDLVDEGSLETDDLRGEPYYECRILPPKLKSPHVICITKDRVANILWAGKNTTIFVFESKEIVDSYKKYFRMLWEQETRTYRGIDNIKNVFHNAVDSLKRGDTWHAFVIGKNPKYIADFFSNLHKKRAGLGMKAKLIYSEEAWKQYKNESKIPLTYGRLVPKSFASPAIVNICGDTVMINFWGTEKEPIVYKIEDKKIAELYKKQFDVLWRIGKKK